MIRVCPGSPQAPGRGRGRRNAAKHAAWFQQSPEIGPLREEEPPVALSADMLHNVVSVDFIEAVVVERQGQVGEIVNDIGIVPVAHVEGDKIGPIDPALPDELLGAAGTAADKEFGHPNLHCWEAF